MMLKVRPSMKIGKQFLNRRFACGVLSKLAEELFQAGFGVPVRAGAEHAGKPERDADIGFGADSVALGGDAPGGDVTVHHRHIQLRFGIIGVPLVEGAYFQMAARDQTAHHVANRVFIGVEIRGQVEVDIEAAVVDGFDAEDHFTIRRRAAEAGVSGHAANGHGEFLL